MNSARQATTKQNGRRGRWQGCQEMLHAMPKQGMEIAQVINEIIQQGTMK